MDVYANCEGRQIEPKKLTLHKQLLGLFRAKKRLGKTGTGDRNKRQDSHDSADSGIYDDIDQRSCSQSMDETIQLRQTSGSITEHTQLGNLRLVSTLLHSVPAEEPYICMEAGKASKEEPPVIGKPSNNKTFSGLAAMDEISQQYEELDIFARTPNANFPATKSTPTDRTESPTTEEHGRRSPPPIEHDVAGSPPVPPRRPVNSTQPEDPSSLYDDVAVLGTGLPKALADNSQTPVEQQRPCSLTHAHGSPVVAVRAVSVERRPSCETSSKEEFEEYTVNELVNCFRDCGLPDVARVCEEERIDGCYFVTYITDEILAEEPFCLKEFWRKKVKNIINGFRPKTVH